MAILNNSNAISSGGYDINNSLRFRSSASAYLNRTPASAGSTTIGTFSFWIKRGALSTAQQIYHVAGTSGNNSRFYLTCNATTDTFSIVGYSSAGALVLELVTTQVFRDPSAWYHFVIAIDTTQATSSNRAKLYINGNQVTAFSTATYPSQNQALGFTNNTSNLIGANQGSSNYFDGYMTDINFIDGSAKTPSDFGETDTTTGVWKPKAYTSTYGTNGFYLKFSDIATTSGSNAGLGKDFSGNTNYWNTNNISVTAGTTYDAMTDSPTLTSATVANYPTLNPLNPLNAPIPAYANANLDVTLNSVSAAGATFAIPSTGKWFWTCQVSTIYAALGIANPSNVGGVTGANAYGVYANNANGVWYAIGSNGTSSNAFNTANDIALFALDADNVKFWIGRNRSGTVTWVGNGDPSAGTSPTFSGAGGGGVYATTLNLSSNTWYPYAEAGSTVTCYFNFGQRTFDTTPPTGYKALNAYNLPDSTIKKGNTVMDATLYTGTSSAQSITNAAGFKPDLIWGKARSTTRFNVLVDSVRGSSKDLYSNATNAEYTDANVISSINSNGFSLGTDAELNLSANTFVAWQWQAGQGSTTTGTGTGGITSVTQSVNATAGFSIVTYTGSGSNGTVTHGLGVAPKWVIVKARSVAAENWQVYSSSLTSAAYRIRLNATDAQDSQPTMWNSTAPTSTVFSVGTASGVNTSAVTYVAYCWAEIAGFSKFGSYTGNSSSDGPFIYTGFRPKFILVKITSSVAGWIIWDSARNTFNVTNSKLSPDTSNAEYTDTAVVGIDFLSNGFKLKGTDPAVNTSAANYIYMAFAENPFKNALAR